MTRFSFWEGDWGIGYNSMKFWDHLDISQFHKILSPKSFDISWGNSYIPCLLLIITICFTCGDNKISSNIKMSQNIMTNIVWEIMSSFTASVVKNNHFGGRIYFIFSKNVIDQTSRSFNTKFRPQWKDEKSSYQVRQIFAIFCKLFVLISG